MSFFVHLGFISVLDTLSLTRCPSLPSIFSPTALTGLFFPPTRPYKIAPVSFPPRRPVATSRHFALPLKPSFLFPPAFFPGPQAFHGLPSNKSPPMQYFPPKKFRVSPLESQTLRRVSPSDHSVIGYFSLAQSESSVSPGRTPPRLSPCSVNLFDHIPFPPFARR